MFLMMAMGDYDAQALSLLLLSQYIKYILL